MIILVLSNVHFIKFFFKFYFLIEIYLCEKEDLKMPNAQNTNQRTNPNDSVLQNKNNNYNPAASQNKKVAPKQEEGNVNKKHILSDSDSLSSSEDSGK